MNSLLLLFISTVLINNLVLTQFLGICPFIGVSKNIESAVGMGGAVIFVLTLASATCWLIQEKILNYYHIEYLQIMFFILIIAALVQFIEMVIKKYSPTLEKMLGVYLPLITTNCAVLGVSILNITKGYSLTQSVISAFGGGTGFALALVIMASIRERLEKAAVPEFIKGVPIAFITASLMSISFMGFAGLISNH